MLDPTAIIAGFTFAAAFTQAFFNFLGNREARKHELELLRLKKELEELDDKKDE